MQTLTLRRTGVFMLTLVVFLLLQITPVHAQTFSQGQINEQNRAVLVEVVNTLEQHLKLLQMLFINQLEERIDELEAQIEAQ